MGQDASPQAQNGLKTVFKHPKWFRNTFGKKCFATGTLVDPLLTSTVRGPDYPFAPPSDHSYGGLGVSLGDSAGSKPQKAGCSGLIRCPRNRVLSHVAQDTVGSWFWALLTQTTCNLGHFWSKMGHKGAFTTVIMDR